MIVLDCGKNTATMYDSTKDMTTVISHDDILNLPEKLDPGTIVVVEYAHLGCPRQKYSLSQPFTADVLLDLYSRFKTNNITLKLFPQKCMPRAVSYSGLSKSDLNDPKSIYLFLKDFPEITLMNPPESFDTQEIIKEGWEWKDITNKILNVARRYNYESEDDANAVFIKDNINYIYDHLSETARDAFNIQKFKSRAKQDTININNINLCQIYSILSVLRDFEGNLRVRSSTGQLPNNYFIKRYVLCMTPFHFRGGVARSNLYYHGAMNWIIKKAKEDGVDLKRKVSITNEDGDEESRRIRRGHFTPEENRVFKHYRKLYNQSIWELMNLFKTMLNSEKFRVSLTI